MCTDDFEEGDEYTIEVEFESNPEPQKVRWNICLMVLNIIEPGFIYNLD